MLGVTVCCLRRLPYKGNRYCQPGSECRIGHSRGFSRLNAFPNIEATLSNRGPLAISYETISPLYRFITGDRLSFLPPTLNSVTSVTHFWFGLCAWNWRSRIFGAARPTSPLQARYFFSRTRDFSCSVPMRRCTVL